MKKKYGFMLAVAVLLAGCGQKKETSVITARPVKTTIVESRSIIRKYHKYAIFYFQLLW